MKDQKRPEFVHDDKVQSLVLKELPFTATADATRKYRIRNQLQTLYWKDTSEDNYYTDPETKKLFDLDKFAKTQPFGSWFETFSETSIANKKIDEGSADKTIKSQRKNALSMYMLNRFIVNALYRADELAVLDYQASPFNYQQKSAYARSFATSYTRALQKKIGVDYGGRLILTRTDQAEDMLARFFEYVEVTDPTVPASDIKAGLAKTISKASDFLMSTDRDLQTYWEVPGNPQGFVDVTPLISTVATDAEKSAEIARLGTLVKENVFDALLAELVYKGVEKRFKNEERWRKEDLRKKAAPMLKEHVKAEEVEAQAQTVETSKEKGAALWDQYKGEEAAFVVWLGNLPKKSKLQQAFIDAPAQRATNFGNVKNDFVAFLRARAKGHRDKVTKATQDDRLRVLHNLLKNKVLRIRAGVPWIVTSGATVTVSDPDDKVEQPGVVLDDKTLDMAVKTAVNKSGNVPTATESSRKLLTVSELKPVVTEVLETQQQSVGGPIKKKLGEMATLVSGFDVATASTITENIDHLAALKKAFDEFEKLGTSTLDAVKVEVGAATKLLKEFVLATTGEDQLPPFVLDQLRELLDDAVKNQSRIADFVRNIQGIHEIVILALEWHNVPIDAKYNYGAPQHATESGKGDTLFQGAHLTDYGLKAFGQVYDAAAAQVKASGQDTLNIEAFYNIYFELQDKLRATKGVKPEGKVVVENPSSVEEYLSGKRFTAIDSVKVKGPDMVFVDIHPNDATKKQIVENDVLHLITDLCTKLGPTGKITVVVDITLNHTTEAQVKNIRVGAQSFIADGRLNLVFVQSLAKFAQLGSDKQSGGLVFAYNDPKRWVEFNAALQEAGKKDVADPAAERYFQALFKHVSNEQVTYLTKVRENTKSFYDMLTKAFKQLKFTSIQLAENKDEGTCYVALRYDEFVTKIWNVTEKVPEGGAHHLNVDVLEKGINKILHQTGLPVAMRFSFGFPVSNLGETGDEVRFTIGLEAHERLKEYANVLSYVSAKLGEHLQKGDRERKELQEESSRQDFLQTITTGVNTIEILNERLKDLVK